MRPPIRSLRREFRVRGVAQRLDVVMRRQPTWDETWARVAYDVAQRSRCVRDKVGAVIVDIENRIVATAYNGVASGHPGEGPCTNFCTRGRTGPTDETVISYEDCPALHAEANCLMVCDRSTRVGGTIYVTSDVCWSCAKLITNSGLTRVVVCVSGNRARHSHRSPKRSYDLLLQCGIKVDLVNA